MAATKRYVVTPKASGHTAHTDTASETIQPNRDIVAEIQMRSSNPRVLDYIPAADLWASLRVIPDRYGRRVPLTALSRMRRSHRMMPPSTFSSALIPDPRIAAVRNVTETLSREMIRLGLDLSGVDTPRLVRSLLHAVPRTDSNELADRTGPFYDTAGLVSWLGISRQALDKRLRTGKLLACMTSDRVRLYPVWQFTDSGDTIQHFTEVLAELSQGTKDGWTIALWMVTQVEQLDGKSAVEWLTSGADPDRVLTSARNDAAAWAA